MQSQWFYFFSHFEISILSTEKKLVILVVSYNTEICLQLGLLFLTFFSSSKFHKALNNFVCKLHMYYYMTFKQICFHLFSFFSLFHWKSHTQHFLWCSEFNIKAWTINEFFVLMNSWKAADTCLNMLMVTFSVYILFSAAKQFHSTINIRKKRYTSRLIKPLLLRRQ